METWVKFYGSTRKLNLALEELQENGIVSHAYIKDGEMRFDCPIDITAAAIAARKYGLKLDDVSTRGGPSLLSGLSSSDFLSKWDEFLGIDKSLK